MKNIYNFTLENLANENKEKYQSASPFSHIYFDIFLNETAAEKALQAFPSPVEGSWLSYKSETENGKFAQNKDNLFPEDIKYILDELNKAPFLQFLENLTGIQGLIPDPYYTGGGMHQTKRGGWLGVHVDFNRLEQLGLYRRINVLLYLNKDYKSEYGGALELWDDTMTKKEHSIEPIFNRLAIFTTSENSHHGHPDPLNFPEGETRKSLAWYYYTAENGETKKVDSHTTVYKQRKGKDQAYLFLHLKQWIRLCTPPIIINIIKKLKDI